MKKIILDFPKQFKTGLEKAEGVGIKGDFENIVICGLGGSAMPGILLCDAFGEELKIPVYIHRSYSLPKVASEKSLIICISFSGNTEETLSAYQKALDKRYSVIALSTGGKLTEMAKENKLPYCIAPNDCLQPRFGSGYLFSAVVKILSNCGMIEDKSQKILEMAENLRPETFEQSGKDLAKKLINTIPIIYSSDQYKSVARIIKIKFNENSKIMAFWNYFPEFNHNEMVGLTNLKGNFYFIILQDKDDNPRNLKRIGLFSQLAREYGAQAEIIEMRGKTKLEKIFNTLLLGDFASYYLALEYGQDPAPVKIVEEFKKRLEE